MNKSHQSKAECQVRFIEYRAQGLSLRKCAKRLKKSITTLSNWARELEGEIARLQAVEMESLYEQYGLVKKSRIEVLGEQVAAIKNELKSRKLSDVDTNKLLELLLRYLDQASAEYVEPIFLSDDDVARLKDKNRTKMDADVIARELGQLLQRYRAGIISGKESAKELAVLQGALKTFESGELQEKFETLTTILKRK